MTTLYTISDEPTKFCREAMKAHGGVWNPVTNAWMFTNAGEHANAMCELYRTARPSTAQLETLLAMAVDGTGAQAWDFDPSVHLPDFTTFSRDEASRLLSAGYTVRRLLGTPGDVVRDVTCNDEADDNYGNAFGGTSGATPKVSAAVALMLAVNDKLTNDQIRTILTNSGGTVTADEGKPVGRLLNFEAAIIACCDSDVRAC